MAGGNRLGSPNSALVWAPRQFNRKSDTCTDIDQAKPLYPIRGSKTTYGCNSFVATKSFNNVGANCTRNVQPKADGVCYQTTFGEWSCAMTDFSHNADIEYHMAPPSGSS